MEEEVKKKSGVKKVILSLVIIVLILVAGYVGLIKYSQNQARKTVDNMFSTMQNGENNNEALTEMLKKSLNNLAEGENNNTQNILCKKLSYNILRTSGNFKNVTVVVEVSNKNMKTVLTNYMAKLLQIAFASAFSDAEISEDEMNKQLETYLEEQIQSEEIETLTNTVTLNFEKNNGEWLLSDQNKTEIINAVLPGLTEFQESLEQSLSEMEE